MKEEPLLNHLDALRACLIRASIAFLVGVAVAGFFAKGLFQFLSKPLEAALPAGSHFIATSPMEAWLVYFKVAMLAGLFLSAPVIFFELWRFISPALYGREKKIGVWFVAFSSIFFASGAIFAYTTVFPICFGYSMSVISGTSIHMLPNMSAYFNFAAQLLIAFGLIFELPLLVFFLAAWEIVSFESFKAFRKYFIVVAFVVAALLTPPDAISQIAMALPLLLLYEVGVWAAWLYRKKSPRV